MSTKIYTLLLTIVLFPAFVGAQCTDLFISEYIEGTANNKYLEIYNPTSAAVNLASYDLQVFSNGAGAASATLALSGTLAAGAVFVIENSAEALGVSANLSTANGVLTFNGDDAIALRRSSSIIDVVGQIGFDPGTQWGAGLQSTQDNGIRRKLTIQSGDANGGNAFDPTIEWDGFAIDDVSGLGAHTMNACAVVIPPSTGGMILNEMSNGPAGLQEYFEYVVIGSAASPLGNVNLSGWIIDDNNGDFEAAAGGMGIAAGHVRIKSGCLSAVKPGSIILFYNEADRNPLIPLLASDPTDANEDCIYIFRISDPCLEQCIVNPSALGASYTCAASYTTPADWNQISLRNDGDAGQVRKPNASFFHGYSYADVDAPFPTFPAEYGAGSAFNGSVLTGTNANYFFNCGNFTTAGNFSRGTVAVNETPGVSNNASNNYFLNAVRTGTYDYTNLNNPLNCGTLASLPTCPTILAINLHAFNAEKQANTVLLNWKLASSDTDIFSFELQRSKDGIEFNTIAQIEGYNFLLNYSYTDYEPMRQNYYRLKMIDANGEYSYSQIRNVNFEKGADVLVFPNPLRGNRQLNLVSETDVLNIQLFNPLGQLVFELKNPNNVIEIPTSLSAGFYTLSIETAESNIIRKLIIE